MERTMSPAVLRAAWTYTIVLHYGRSYLKILRDIATTLTDRRGASSQKATRPTRSVAGLKRSRCKTHERERRATTRGERTRSDSDESPATREIREKTTGTRRELKRSKQQRKMKAKTKTKKTIPATPTTRLKGEAAMESKW